MCLSRMRGFFMLIKHIFPQTYFVTLFTGFARRAYYNSVEGVVACGMGGGDCKWNNSVAKARIQDEMNATGIKLSTISFGELKQIAKKTIGKDMQSFFEHKERGAAYEQRYQITERGLAIVGGIDDEKLFHEIFIDRPQKLGPQRGYIPDEKELARLELFEQSVMSGRKNFVTATGDKGAYRYVEKWEVHDDGIVVVRGKDIGKVKGVLSEKEVSTLLQRILGVTHKDALDAEGLLFAVNDKSKMEDVFDKASKVLTATEVTPTTKSEVHAVRTKPVLSDIFTENLGYTSIHRGNRIGDDARSRFNSSYNQSEKHKSSPVIEVQFSVTKNLSRQTQKITQKIAHDTTSSLLLFATWTGELWRERRRKKLEVNHILTTKTKPQRVQHNELFFAKLRQRVFKESLVSEVFLRRQRIYFDKKLVGESLPKNLRHMRERIVIVAQKKKKEVKQKIIRKIQRLFYELTLHYRHPGKGRRFDPHPGSVPGSDSGQDGYQTVTRQARMTWLRNMPHEVVRRIKISKLRERFFVFFIQRTFKKERLAKRRDILLKKLYKENLVKTQLKPEKKALLTFRKRIVEFVQFGQMRTSVKDALSILVRRRHPGKNNQENFQFKRLSRIFFWQRFWTRFFKSILVKAELLKRTHFSQQQPKKQSKVKVTHVLFQYRLSPRHGSVVVG